MKNLRTTAIKRVFALAMASIFVLSAAPISSAQEARCGQDYDGSGAPVGPYCKVDLPQ